MELAIIPVIPENHTFRYRSYTSHTMCAGRREIGAIVGYNKFDPGVEQRGRLYFPVGDIAA